MCSTGVTQQQERVQHRFPHMFIGGSIMNTVQWVIDISSWLPFSALTVLVERHESHLAWQCGDTFRCGMFVSESHNKILKISQCLAKLQATVQTPFWLNSGRWPGVLCIILYRLAKYNQNNPVLVSGHMYTDAILFQCLDTNASKTTTRTLTAGSLTSLTCRLTATTRKRSQINSAAHQIITNEYTLSHLPMLNHLYSNA